MQKNWCVCARRLWGRGEESYLRAFCSWRIMHCSHVASTSKSFFIPVFSRFSHFWNSIFSQSWKLPSSLAFRKQWRCHWCNNKYLGDQDEDHYNERINNLEQRWRKCIKMKGDYIKNSGKPFIPGYSEVPEAENFLIISHTLKISNNIIWKWKYKKFVVTGI